MKILHWLPVHALGIKVNFLCWDMVNKDGDKSIPAGVQLESSARIPEQLAERILPYLCQHDPSLFHEQRAKF